MNKFSRILNLNIREMMRVAVLVLTKKVNNVNEY